MRPWYLANHRKDTVEPKIVEALKAAGFQVWDMLPTDLLTWRPDLGWKPLECKTPYGKASPKARIDKRQQKQIEFLELTGCPVVLSPEQALRELGVL